MTKPMLRLHFYNPVKLMIEANITGGVAGRALIGSDDVGKRGCVARAVSWTERGDIFIVSLTEARERNMWRLTVV